MFNFHGGTVISTLTLALGNILAVFLFYEVSHIAVVLSLLFLSFAALFILTATLVRFFTNLKRCGLSFFEPEQMPDTK